MKDREHSVALVGFSDPAARALAQAIRETEAFRVEDVPSTLSSINGHAVDLAKSHGVIIFRTDTSTGNDVPALKSIRAITPGKSRIIALTEGSASLQAAHILARAGADTVLPDTVSAEELRAVIKESISAIAKPAEDARAPGRIISVSQARGGIGATTVAVNLAHALLHQEGRRKKTAKNRVALVDLDLQFGAVAGFLDVPRNDSLFQIAKDSMIPDAVFLEQSMIRLESGLAVLPAPTSLVPVDALQPEQVRAIMETLSTEYDYVVVDLPRTLVGWIAPVLEMSARMLMVTDTAVPSIQQARRLIDFYTEDHLGLAVDVIVNREKRPMFMGRHHTEATHVLERQFAAWLPDDRKAMREAIDRGVPLAEAARRSPVTKAITKLCRSLETAFEQSSVSRKSVG
ncbi:AAA family ATPase [Tropicimonas isoalkanivorans]|uniref:Pilus assembly protein CpaE n=1 Tax=Tropicimonas isoalkanivorans TaxID=441112 RepID=A0A1I1GF61_9RHOB|nr:AAA family ATPase [Tropicimonas isoalkanivorans]SFC07800.1 pilus assembly protein CpaE [Tropicimonas isoalkanivorans]